MGTVPVERTWTAGESTTYVMMNDISNCLGFYQNPPSAHVYRTAGQTVPYNSNQLITWDSVYEQNDNGWSSTTNPSRITINTSGYYNVTASALWANGTAANAGGCAALTVGRNQAGVRPAYNSTNQIATDLQLVPGLGYYYDRVSADTWPYMYVPTENHIDTMCRFVAGDYVEMWMKFWKSSSSSRIIQGGVQAKFLFHMAVQWNGA